MPAPQDFWVGRIWGIAAYDKDSLIYDNHETGEAHCIIQHLWAEKKVTTKVDYDKTPGCSAYHGATGGFVGETFNLGKRQDIRYMQRLRDSKEFNEAMEKYRWTSPPEQEPDISPRRSKSRKQFREKQFGDVH